REAWRRGAHPVLALTPPDADDRIVREGSAEQLAYADALLLEGMREADAIVVVNAPLNTRARTTLPAERSAARAESRRPIQEVSRQRFLKPGGRWLICPYPTAAAAQEAQMGLQAFERFVYSACFLDEPDPAAEWRALAVRQERLVERLSAASQIRARAPGTDLVMSVE